MSKPVSPDELRRLNTLLREKRPRAYESLRPPASEAACRALAACIPDGYLPDELQTWFDWHDGQSCVATVSPRDNFTLHTAESARAAYLLINDPTNEALEPHPVEWLPLLENGAGDHIVYECSTGQLVRYLHDDPTRPIVADSLGQWVRDTCKALEADHTSYAPLAPHTLADVVWSPLSAAPTKAELEAAPAGTAFRYGKRNWTPMDNGPYLVHLFIKTIERGWLASHGESFDSAAAQYRVSVPSRRRRILGTGNRSTPSRARCAGTGRSRAQRRSRPNRPAGATPRDIRVDDRQTEFRGVGANRCAPPDGRIACETDGVIEPAHQRGSRRTGGTRLLHAVRARVHDLATRELHLGQPIRRGSRAQ